jgi:hypothetical protein
LGRLNQPLVQRDRRRHSRILRRRNLRRLQRYPSLTLMLAGMPIVFLLLFVYVFGGQLAYLWAMRLYQRRQPG